MVRLCMLGDGKVDKPCTQLFYLGHKACTAFDGKALGELVVSTLTDPKGLALTKAFVLAQMRGAAYDGEYVNLKVRT